MVKMEVWMDIKMLYKEGNSISAIARQTGLSRKTIRKVIKEKVPKEFKKVKRKSKLDPYKGYIKERYEESAVSAIRIKQEIEQMGYEGSIEILRRYIAGIRNQEISTNVS